MQSSQKPTLFFSLKSPTCVKFLKLLQEKGLLKELITCNIDDPNNKRFLPKNAKQVPLILIKQPEQGRLIVLEGKQVLTWVDYIIKSKMQQGQQQRVQHTMQRRPQPQMRQQPQQEQFADFKVSYGLNDDIDGASVDYTMETFNDRHLQGRDGDLGSAYNVYDRNTVGGKEGNGLLGQIVEAGKRGGMMSNEERLAQYNSLQLPQFQRPAGNSLPADLQPLKSEDLRRMEQNNPEFNPQARAAQRKSVESRIGHR